LQLLHAVYLLGGGSADQRISDNRFAMDPALVRRTMDRLVSFMPMQGDFGFPAHVIKECEDWDHEASDDSTYRAEEFDWTGHGRELAVDVARPVRAEHRAARSVAGVPVIRRCRRPSTRSRRPPGPSSRWRATVARVAVETWSRRRSPNDEQIKIQYVSGVAEKSQVRTIEPREIKVLNGHTYVRAYCTTREAWRTFRVDRISTILAKSPALEERPADEVANWLTQVGNDGDEVVVVVEGYLRWLFETLPNAQWTTLEDPATRGEVPALR
jgi:hypothetical protein